MRHDQPADEARGHAPRCRPHVVEPARGRLELHAERLGEVLAEEVRGPRLHRLVVLHQAFECVGPHRAREALAVGLQTRQHRQREPLLLEPAVHAEDQARLGLRFVRRGVRRVPFLPQELRGAQEQPRAHLPADDVAPLVEQHRQVAVALDPFREHAVDDRLRRRPHDQRLLERRGRIDLDGTLALFACRPQPRMCDERNLLRESFDVLGLLREVAHRDEEREVGVLVAARLDHVVERALHQLPDAVAVRPDDHAAAHGRIVS